MKRVLLCQFRDGDTKVTADGTALLIGISVEELLERWDPAAGASNLPPDLQRRGQKRTRTARNATGGNDGCSVLGYWALMTWPGCRLDFDETSGRMWALVDE
ncbi:hypothetical protein [Mycobacterium intracellulare]|uniref:hypothetical protein n=1 Tax=Mycobacterium intracellulare TaxID=1767 RepID=UPI0034D4CC02